MQLAQRTLCRASNISNLSCKTAHIDAQMYTSIPTLMCTDNMYQVHWIPSSQTACRHSSKLKQSSE